MRYIGYMNEYEYEIDIDRVDTDELANIRELDRLAAVTGADFTDIRVVDNSHAVYVTLRFFATTSDIERYAAYYDFDPSDVITHVS